MEDVSSQIRITPAHAGKRAFCVFSAFQPPDHPRTRGEKLIEAALKRGYTGSPPHTRGKALLYMMCLKQEGITPAHAGKRALPVLYFARIWDHPRTRGEKCLIGAVLLPSRGSPPHTRGKDCFRNCEALTERITPAHAGKSALVYVIAVFMKDHPRTRGEKCMQSPVCLV